MPIAAAALLLACGARSGAFDAGQGGSGAGSVEDAGNGGGGPRGGGVGGGEGGGSAAGGSAGSGELDSGVDGGSDPRTDRDGDGLDDALESALAEQYLPSLMQHPMEKCPRSGIIYRARPHPQDATLVLILYDQLFERDCGVGAHWGDNETFAVTVNPLKPAPSGLTAMKAISHQNTLCQKITACGTCSGLASCEPDASGRPRRFSSRDKHGGYVLRASCTLVSLCPDDCGDVPQIGVPLVNVGEPGAHLVEDLTTQGFVTADAGWSHAALFHFNPWGPDEFGTAGKPSGDLVDSAFDPPACR